MKSLCALPLAALLALLPAGVAAADSVVYVKDANVWVAAPDGSHARQITTDGSNASIALAYSSPSQADDGTILALRGDRFVRLDRTGRTPPAWLDSVMTNKPASVSAIGPMDPQISPDGTKIAYWVGIFSTWHDYGSGYTYVEPGSHIVYQDARTGTPLGLTRFYEDPSWLADSRRVLASDDLAALTANFVIGYADHDGTDQWFGDFDTKAADEEYARPIGDGELTRDERRLAVLRGGTNVGNGGATHGQGNVIRIYKVNGLNALPAPCGGVVDAVGGEFGAPSWSPPGDALAWAEGDGIWSMRVDGDCQGQPHLTIPGGRQPDWGPADPGSPAPAPADGGRPGSGGAAATLAVPRRIARRTLLRRGMTATVTCPSRCSATATLRARGRAVGRASASGGPTLRVVVRVRRASAKRLRQARSLALAVRVAPQGGATRTLTRTIALR